MKVKLANVANANVYVWANGINMINLRSSRISLFLLISGVAGGWAFVRFRSSQKKKLGSSSAAASSAKNEHLEVKPNSATHADLSDEELLFYGSIPVFFSPIPGEVKGTPVAWKEVSSLSAQEKDQLESVALSRLDPPKELGNDYHKCVVPALPRLDPVPEEGEKEWPPALGNQVLIKVPENLGEIQGVASGVRSALIKAGGEWFRLKGCGNNDQGFPVEIKGDNGEVSVRGSCFWHTALVELEMSEKVRHALAEKNAGVVGNIPVGLYAYSTNKEWPLPKIRRYCGVFKTMGNRRLGDHLLAGLEELIPHICPADSPTSEHLLQYLTASVACKREGASPRAAAAAPGGGADQFLSADPDALLDTADLVACELPTADLAAFALHEVAPPTAAEARRRGLAVPPRFAPLWDAACRALRGGGGGAEGGGGAGGAGGGAAGLLAAKRAAPGVGSVLLWLAGRLGREAGCALRAMHAAGLCWGTYPDKMGVHCNAHPNNFVVNRPAAPGEGGGGGGGGGRFLSVVDLDMAFPRAAFLPAVVRGAAQQVAGGFEDLLAIERASLAQGLAGSDFASTGVANRRGPPLAGPHRAVRLAFRDTAVAAYRAALAGEGEEEEGGEEAVPAGLRAAADALVRLALVLTCEDAG